MATPALTNLQRDLLDLFATDLSEDDLREVRQVLSRHFAAKATEAFDAFAEREGLSPADTDRWAHGHERGGPDQTGGDPAAGDGPTGDGA